MRRRPPTCADFCPEEPHARTLLHRSRRRHGGHSSLSFSSERGTCVAVFDRVAACGCGDFLSSRCAVYRGARGDRLCRRHHGAVCLCGDDAESGPSEHQHRARLADAGDVGRSHSLGRNSRSRGGDNACADNNASRRNEYRGSKGSQPRAIRVIPDRCGAGVISIDGRFGWGISLGSSNF